MSISISGPSYVSEYQLGAKRIYLFGEWHGQTNRCPNGVSMHQFLTEIIANSTQMIDLYLEESRQTKYSHHGPLKDPNDELHALRWTFSPCLDFEEKECPWQQVRVHFVDVRFIEDPTNPEVDIPIDTFECVTMKLKTANENRTKLKLTADEAKLIQTFQTYQSLDQYIQFIWEYMLASPVISAALAESSLPFKQLQAMYFNVMQADQELHKLFQQVTAETISLADLLLRLSSMVVNMYTVIMLFHSREQPKNIIMYFGFFHAVIISDMLEFLGFRLLFHHEEPIEQESRCLQVELPNPLF